jgi:hypothetical protein
LIELRLQNEQAVLASKYRPTESAISQGQLPLLAFSRMTRKRQLARFFPHHMKNNML